MKRLVAYSVAFISIIWAGTLQAAGYPDKIITFYIGQSPGGASDIQAQLLSRYLEKYLPNDAKVVVVGRPGAGGAIAFNLISTAKPDGYTVGYINAPPIITQIIEKKVNFGLNDFTYLGQIFTGQASLVTGLDSRFKSLKDVVDFAKANPRKLTVGFGTLGGDDHLLALRFSRLAGVEFTMVPFGDDANARNALLGGHVDIGSMSLVAADSFKDSLHVLGTMSAERMKFAPDVPTFREQGFDVVGGALRIFAAPPGLPPEIKQTITGAVEKAIADLAFNAEAAKTFSYVDYLNSEQIKARVLEDEKVLKELWEESPWVKK